jgi:hypothetical protein
VTFKQRRYECAACGEAVKALKWDYDAPPVCCDRPMYETGMTYDKAAAVIDDQLEGGPRRFETMGPDAPFISTKSEWRREVDKRQLRNVVRHEQSYYDTNRKRRDEERHDTGTNREY